MNILDHLFLILTYVVTFILFVFSLNGATRVFDKSSFRIKFLALADYTSHNDYKRFLIFRRTRDFTAALVLIAVLAPTFIMLSFVIKLTSTGPIFYKTRKRTLFGSSLIITKFRTFTIHKNKATVTKFGSFLIKSKLDSLPMIFDLLAGKLSLVGLTIVPYSLSLSSIGNLPNIIFGNHNPNGIKPGLFSLFTARRFSYHSYYRIADDPKFYKYILLVDSIYIKKTSFWLDEYILLKTLYLITVGSTLLHKVDELDKEEITEENRMEHEPA